MAASGMIASLAGDGGDPRLSVSSAHVSTAIRPQERALYDVNVSFEEYLYYAAKTRAEEDSSRADEPQKRIKDLLFPSKGGSRVIETTTIDGEKRRASIPTANLSDAQKRAAVTDEEWTNANRALRNASAAACFYLITTDILGPFGIGFSLGTMGWVQGIILFTLFGICAGFSGWLLWSAFMGLDSYEFPAKNYGDLAFRVWGSIPRYVVNTLQSIQLIVSVGVIVIGNGESLSQVAKFRLCYAVCCLLWAIAGFGLGQIRTLQKFGWLANVAVFMNLMIMFISMGVMAHSPPNYAISPLGSAGQVTNPASVTPVNGKYPPKVTYALAPPSDNGFIGAINGLMQGVYAYAGAQLFVEFMAELYRPRDFLKAMWGAQFFIYTCYMVYGSYVYYWQGQYAYNIAYQGLSSYAWQTVCNMIGILSGCIAATLYGNIGIKVLYNNVFMELLRAPPLTSRGGKMLWAVIVPIYWSLAFIIAAAIPDFVGLTSIVAAVCFVQFTYTFPGLIGLGYFVQRNALRLDQGEGFDPHTGRVTRHDRGLKRLLRGFFARRWYLNIWLVIYIGGALSVSGLGAYSAIQNLRAAFQFPQVNSFTCTSPLNIGSS